MEEKTILIPISDIIEIEGITDRELDIKHVESLVAINEIEKWPPLIVTPIGKKYGRIAGKHRLAAARLLQCKELKAFVRTYKSKEEMYSAMWDDNARNGLSLTTKQRKEYALALYKLQPSLALRELGRRAGLPHQTVKAAIQEYQGNADNDETQTSYNRDMIDYTKRLLSSLNQFFTNEKALLGSRLGSRSETIRAKALSKKMDANEENIARMQSLARTFSETATLLAKKAKG